MDEADKWILTLWIARLFRFARSIQEFPHAQRFGNGPRLRIATAWRMRRVAIYNFGNLPKTAFVHQPFHSTEMRAGRGSRVWREIPRAGKRFAEIR